MNGGLKKNTQKEQTSLIYNYIYRIIKNTHQKAIFLFLFEYVCCLKISEIFKSMLKITQNK